METTMRGRYHAAPVQRYSAPRKPMTEMEWYLAVMATLLCLLLVASLYGIITRPLPTTPEIATTMLEGK